MANGRESDMLIQDEGLAVLGENPKEALRAIAVETEGKDPPGNGCLCSII